MPKLVPYSHVRQDGIRVARKKPWQAYRRRGGRGISLGYYHTKEEALAAEKEFDKEWPPKHVA